MNKSVNNLAISRDKNGKCWLYFVPSPYPFEKVEISRVEMLRLRFDYDVKYKNYEGDSSILP